MPYFKKPAGLVLVLAIAIVLGIAGAFVTSNKNNPLSLGGKSDTTQAGKRQFKYDKAALDLLLGKIFLYDLHLAKNIDKYTEMGVPSFVADYGQKQKDFKSLTGNFEQRVKECLSHQEFLSKLDPSQSGSATDRVAVHNVEVEQSRCEDQFNRIDRDAFFFLTGKENFQVVALLLNQRGLPGASIVQKIQEEYKSEGQGKPSQP
jgi:hypothetical protein